MKYFFSILVIFLVQSAFANQCKVEGAVKLHPSIGGEPTSRVLSTQTFIENKNSWLDCHKLAISKAQDMANVVGDEENLDDVYFSWEYQDGSWLMLSGQFFNSSGLVTQYSPHFEDQPRRGDQRFNSNGSRFLDTERHFVPY